MTSPDCEYCTRCGIKTEDDLLREIAYDEHRYLSDLVKKAREHPDSFIGQEAARQLAQRLDIETPGQETDENTRGMFRTESDDRQPGNVPGPPGRNRTGINEEDIKKALEEYEHEGLIGIQNGKVIVTSKGVKKLAAGALERILKNLNRKNSGSYPAGKLDFGTELSLLTRRYEAGDDYSLVDLERTSLNALRRSGRLKFEPEDFEVYEEIPQAKLCAGIIIDESGSMRDSHKLEAAMETALALARLIRQKPENTLKLFVFSDKVRQIEPGAVLNHVISGGDTDIKAALAAFRYSCRQEYGEKQAYLITDTEPNNEDGRHLPFAKAAAGVIEEASRYRQERIGLNIIMLDEVPQLKNLASVIAQKNLGRVFFTSPSRLGEVLIEDYISGRREKGSSSSTLEV